MIKFHAGFIPKRQAHLVGFGLTEGNLQKLLEDKPIAVKSEELTLPPPGAIFVIFGGKDKAEIEVRAKEAVEVITGNTQKRIACLHIQEQFYVIPLEGGDKMIYLIGLDDVSYRVLREGKPLTFRARGVSGPTTNVEVMIFWGESEEAVMELFRKEGVIGLNTIVTDKKNPHSFSAN